MKYLILTIASVDYAKAISRFLWSIQKNKDHSTEYYNNWIVHPNTNEVALAFPDMEIFIDENADATQLVNQIRQAITEDEAIQMENTINAGGIVKPVDFIPSSLGNNILTRSEAEASGWFNFE